MLTNREIATLIIVVPLIIFLLLKREIRVAFSQLLKGFFSGAILRFNLLFSAYSATLIYVAWSLKIWDTRLIKDSVIVLLAVGYPMVYQVFKIKDGSLLVRDTLKKCLGVTAFAALYVNLSSLNIVAELTIQVLSALLVGISIFVRGDDARPIRAVVVADSVLGIMGLSIFLVTTLSVVNSLEEFDFELNIKSAALTIWLPLLLLPFVYVSSYIMQIQMIFIRMPVLNERQEIPNLVKFAIFFGLRGSVQLASKFTGQWPKELAQTKKYQVAARQMTQFRESCKLGDDS